MRFQYILALDFGTTQSTALLLRISEVPPFWDIVSQGSALHPQSYPQEGFVEQDPKDWLISIKMAIEMAFQKARDQDNTFQPHHLKAVGITAQRETLCVYDAKTLMPLRQAIVWQCRRSTDICRKLSQEQGLEDHLRAHTGLLLDPYFTGSKLLWLKNEEKNLHEELQNGRALWGTVDTYVLHNLTGGKLYVTDPTHASRTLLMNLQTRRWDQDLQKLWGLSDNSPMPEIRPSVGFFGHTKNFPPLPDGIPITASLGDQQAALAGNFGFRQGDLKCTYGTGSFLLFNTGLSCPKPPKGLLATVAWQLDDSMCFYALEGAIFIAGAAVQYLVKQLNWLSSPAESDLIASSVSAAPDLYFVPALSGLGSPWWNPRARGAFLGLTQGATKSQLIRAVLEGIAFSVGDVIRVMVDSGGVSLKSLNVDGGASHNETLLRFQAQILEHSVQRRPSAEATALGAGLMAAFGSGCVTSLSELQTWNPQATLIQPSPVKAKELENLWSGWKRALKAVEVFSE